MEEKEDKQAETNEGVKSSLLNYNFPLSSCSETNYKESHESAKQPKVEENILQY